MRLEHRQAIEGPLIQGFSGGGFRIDENVYAALMITPLRADGWSPPAIETLEIGSFSVLLSIDPAPEFILLGTGKALVRPPITLTKACEARGIGIEAMDSRAAARAWGVLRAEGRWIVGAFYPM